MAVPEELVQMEREIKKLQQLVVNLRTKAKDYVAERNRIALEIRRQEEVQDEYTKELRQVLDVEVIDMHLYKKAREKLWSICDLLEMSKIKLSRLDSQVKAVNDELPTIEAMLKTATAKLAEWGTVVYPTFAPPEQ